MSQEHLVALSQHCRVCGSRFKTRKGPQSRTFSCSDRHDDSEATHPKSYCHSCNNIIYHTHKKAQCGKEYNPHKVIAQWLAHSDNNCSVCESSSTPNVGGRPKKQLLQCGDWAHQANSSPHLLSTRNSHISSHLYGNC